MKLAVVMHMIKLVRILLCNCPMDTLLTVASKVKHLQKIYIFKISVGEGRWEEDPSLGHILTPRDHKKDLDQGPRQAWQFLLEIVYKLMAQILDENVLILTYHI